jgi:hypothetical protein
MSKLYNSETLKDEISSLRAELIAHPLYPQIRDLAHIKTFMESHIYAVWDFMSLLKSLQSKLTCVKVPWQPVKDANTSYLINEIVLGEESDVDEEGNRTSHFELYLKAMKQAGANTDGLNAIFEELEKGKNIKSILKEVQLDKAILNFLSFTFDKIEENKPHVLAAIFTYGREDLIPDMFLAIVKDLDAKFPKQLATFKYYLERHIEVDGEHHSILAYQMTDSLCCTEQHWQEATEAVKEALKVRIKLWDAILLQLN